MITLKRLNTILNEEFRAPFLPAGTVQSQFLDRGRLMIRIGARDIEIDSRGAVLGSGTVFSSPQRNSRRGKNGR